MSWPPKPAPGLSARAKRVWGRIVESWAPDCTGEHHFCLLTEALRSLDRADRARRTLDRHGITYPDRFGQPKERPEVSVEHKHRNLFRLLIRDLELDFDPDGDGFEDGDG